MATELADILTKGNFKRDEWNHLLSLFNISHFSSTVCSADSHHQVIQKRIMVVLGLLKSGKVRLRRTIDQGNLRKLLECDATSCPSS